MNKTVVKDANSLAQDAVCGLRGCPSWWRPNHKYS